MAKGKTKVAPAAAGAPNDDDGPARFAFDIEWVNLESLGLSDHQQAMVRSAGERWGQVLDSFSAPVLVGNDVIVDVQVEVRLQSLDQKILAQAAPTGHRRPDVKLPVKGIMEINSNRLAFMTPKGLLRDVVLHELGHVLGIGTIAQWNVLVDANDPGNPLYLGDNGKRAYAEIRGSTALAGVPVEPFAAGPGSGGSHWAEQRLPNELMSSRLTNGAANPLSVLTIAALKDLGYKVNMAAADSAGILSQATLAAMGINPMSAIECGTAQQDEGETFEVPFARPRKASRAPVRR